MLPFWGQYHVGNRSWANSRRYSNIRRPRVPSLQNMIKIAISKHICEAYPSITHFHFIRTGEIHLSSPTNRSFTSWLNTIWHWCLLLETSIFRDWRSFVKVLRRVQRTLNIRRILRSIRNLCVLFDEKRQEERMFYPQLWEMFATLKDLSYHSFFYNLILCSLS